MPRTVTLTFDDNSTHVYNNVPDDVAPAAIEQRAGADFQGKKLKGIDGGKSAGETGPLATAAGAVSGAIKSLNPMIAGSEQLNKISDLVGSGVTEGLSRMGASPEVSAGTGTAANLGLGAVVAGGAGRAATAASPLLEEGARRLMQSSIKPNLASRTSGASDRAIDTMLERGINATHGGMEATQARVSSLENTINTVLENSPATVDKFAVAKNLKKAVEDTKLSLNRAKNLEDVRAAYNDFWNHDAIKALNDIPVALANKMKQAFYKELSEKAYQPGTSLSSYDKAEKALAGGLRSETLKAEPAIAPSLAEQSELLNVLKVAGPQVSREGNKNVIGLGWLSPTMERTAMWMLDRYPWFKSMLARGMYSGSERIPQAAVGAGVAAAEDVRTLANRK